MHTNALDRHLIKDIIQWDVTNWSVALRFFESQVNWANVHECLELGAHRGGLSLWLALKGKHVLCSDIHTRHQEASLLHSRYAVTTIDYATLNTLELPFENHFDLIVFKSVLGAIGRHNRQDLQMRAMHNIYHALKPGGYLLFAENLLASPIHQYLRKHWISWGDSWRYVTQQELHNMLAPFRHVSMHTTGVVAAFGKHEWQRTYLGLLDQYLLSKIMPKSFHYLAYAVAQK